MKSWTMPKLQRKAMLNQKLTVKNQEPKTSTLAELIKIIGIVMQLTIMQ